MHLSKLHLDLTNRCARRDLARCYEMHRTLWRAFPDGGPGRVLFRVDAQGRGAASRVLVQSEHAPDWSALPAGYATSVETKPFDLAVATGQRLRFRLRANPTKRVAAGNERLGPVMVGKRVGLTTESAQLDWLIRKGQDAGFSLLGGWVEANDPETDAPIRLPNFRVGVAPEGTIRTGKPGRDGVVLSVLFEGVLTVTDADRFRAGVSAGIGPSKAFGFGLLSVAPA